MVESTKIEWADHTFSPWWGCSKVSPACAHCYAAAFSHRLGRDLWSLRDGEGDRRPQGSNYWDQPLAWNRRAERTGTRERVFCGSMCDVLERHPVADREREKLWPLIRATPWLIWMFLTKRPENAGMIPADVLRLIWLGTTVESARWRHRLDELLTFSAALHFTSLEPLLGFVDLGPYVGAPDAPDDDVEGDRSPLRAVRVPLGGSIPAHMSVPMGSGRAWVGRS